MRNSGNPRSQAIDEVLGLGDRSGDVRDGGSLAARAANIANR